MAIACSVESLLLLSFYSPSIDIQRAAAVFFVPGQISTGLDSPCLMCLSTYLSTYLSVLVNGYGETVRYWRNQTGKRIGLGFPFPSRYQKTRLHGPADCSQIDLPEIASQQGWCPNQTLRPDHGKVHPNFSFRLSCVSVRTQAFVSSRCECLSAWVSRRLAFHLRSSTLLHTPHSILL